MFNLFVVPRLVVGSVSLRTIHTALDRGKCSKKVLMVIVRLKKTNLSAHLEAVMRHKVSREVENSTCAVVGHCLASMFNSEV